MQANELSEILSLFTRQTGVRVLEVAGSSSRKSAINEIVRLREKTRAALGARFDLASYDDAVIKTGGVPLELLEGVIDGYIASKRA